MFDARDGFSISIHQFADEDWRPYFGAIEPVFWKYEGRPHWGKLHSLDAPRLAELYPRWGDFQAVRQALDPRRRMANAYLAQILGAVEVSCARPTSNSHGRSACPASCASS